MKDNFFVVIPAYNEEKTIAKVISGVKKYTKNIIVVDDGSTDKTFSLAKKTGVLVLKHIINLGKGAALKTGCEAAIKLGAKNLILMDADGQHLPFDIPRFKKELFRREGLILGTRINQKKPYIRFFGSIIASYLIKILFGKKISDPLCGFRALSKKTYKEIKWDSSGYSVETEMIIDVLRKRVKICQIPITTIYIDKYKGVTFIDGFRILLELIGWRFNFQRTM